MLNWISKGKREMNLEWWRNLWVIFTIWNKIWGEYFEELEYRNALIWASWVGAMLMTLLPSWLFCFSSQKNELITCGKGCNKEYVVLPCPIIIIHLIMTLDFKRFILCQVEKKNISILLDIFFKKMNYNICYEIN